MQDPKEHAQRRRQFSQSFASASVKAWEPLVLDRVHLAVAKIKRDALRGDADILQWFTFMATDVSGELSFGKSFEMLQQEKVSKLLYPNPDQWIAHPPGLRRVNICMMSRPP